MIDPSTECIYIVTDTKGGGRVVGAFHDRERAENIRAVDKAYFRITALPFDCVNPIAVEWLIRGDQRDELRRL